ncbi:MAG: STAS domain-containing protein [Acidimicrobiales bacterium]
MPGPSDLAPAPNRASATDEPWAGVGDTTMAGPLPDASVYPPPWGRAALPPRPATARAGTMALGSSSLLGGVGLAGLDVTEWTMGSSVVLSIAGEVDIATTAELSEALGTALGSGVKRLVCDLSGVGFLDAAGLQSLSRRVIALVGLDSVFALHDRVAEAVDAQAQRAAPFELTRSRMPTDLRSREEYRGGTFKVSPSTSTDSRLDTPASDNGVWEPGTDRAGGSDVTSGPAARRPLPSSAHRAGGDQRDGRAYRARGALGSLSVSKDPKSSQTAVLVDLVRT